METVEGHLDLPPGVGSRVPNFDANSVDFKPFVEQRLSRDVMKRIDYIKHEDQPNTHDRFNESTELGQAYSGGGG